MRVDGTFSTDRKMYPGLKWQDMQKNKIIANSFAICDVLYGLVILCGRRWASNKTIQDCNIKYVCITYSTLQCLHLYAQCFQFS